MFVVKAYNMESVKTLIDTAIERCGSASALARRMGVDRAEITKLQKGTRPMSPELAAEIADIAGEDARQAAIDAIILRAKGTRKEQVMRDILGKALAAGVMGLLAFSYNGDSTSVTEEQKTALKTNVDIKNQQTITMIVSSRVRRFANRIYRLYGFVCGCIPAMRSNA